MDKQDKTYKLSYNEESSEVFISGDLSLNNANSIKNDLVKLYKKGKPVSIIISDIIVIDLGFIQLIRSFLFSMLEDGVKSSVKFNLSDEMSTLFKRSGLKTEY
ncbi:hypothetical protein [Tenuifilum thalassicum]|uniref:STAS domain-containing protein n=1 Tax=Tenuifilum thalassicum TaxID=2590900 RepID=A0A7D4CRG1_9BACT|nr:hypothetical protein [Tenuifilum thalassicum]QKG80085.1 hypothetical protein FHG85_07360 [Tenuifilum thalassicum]